jgi:hypothetical protein
MLADLGTTLLRSGGELELGSLGLRGISGTVKVDAMTDHEISLEARGLMINGVEHSVARIELRLSSDLTTWALDYRSHYISRVDYTDVTPAARKTWLAAAEAVAAGLAAGGDDLAEFIMQGVRAMSQMVIDQKHLRLLSLLDQEHALRNEIAGHEQQLLSFEKKITGEQLDMARRLVPAGHSFDVALEAARAI